VIALANNSADISLYLPPLPSPSAPANVVVGQSTYVLHAIPGAVTTPPIRVRVGDSVYVGVAAVQPAAISDIADSQGNSFTFATSSDNGTAGQPAAALFYLDNILYDDDAYTVTVTFASTDSTVTPVVSVVALSNVYTVVSSVDATATGRDTASPAAVSLHDLTSTSDLVLASVAVLGPQPTLGQTLQPVGSVQYLSPPATTSTATTSPLAGGLLVLPAAQSTDVTVSAILNASVTSWAMAAAAILPLSAAPLVCSSPTLAGLSLKLICRDDA
jgi:hypothetical protein